jgi:hypothetical protein
MQTTQRTEMRNDEDLRAGDTIRLIGGLFRIISIRPYNGPLSDVVCALADLDRGVGVSLCFGQQTETVI